MISGAWSPWTKPIHASLGGCNISGASALRVVELCTRTGAPQMQHSKGRVEVSAGVRSARAIYFFRRPTTMRMKGTAFRGSDNARGLAGASDLVTRGPHSVGPDNERDYAFRR